MPMIKQFGIAWIFTTRNRGPSWLTTPRRSAWTLMRCRHLLKLLTTFSAPSLAVFRRCAKFHRQHQLLLQQIEGLIVGILKPPGHRPCFAVFHGRGSVSLLGSLIPRGEQPVTMGGV